MAIALLYVGFLVSFRADTVMCLLFLSTFMVVSKLISKRNKEEKNGTG